VSHIRPSMAWQQEPGPPIDIEISADGVLQDPAEAALQILAEATNLSASDVHVRVGAPPFLRLEGELRPVSFPPLNEHFVHTAAESLAIRAGVSAEKLRNWQLDFSCVIPGIGRFRAHLYRQSATHAMVLRRVPHPIPDFAALRLPPVVKRIALADRGLVLVAGPAGNGKSTTAASILQYINQSIRSHIVCVEDPVEYVFQNQIASFSQREVGRDVESIEHGLMGALREDPDVLFIGEIRTLDALDMALNAAESGRMVISTCASQDSQRTIARLTNLAPSDYRDSLRSRMADNLIAIIAQRLLPRKGTRTRVLCTEVLTNSTTVRECIRDPNRLRGLAAALDAGAAEFGSHSFDQMLISLVRDGLVSLETAQAVATNPVDVLRAIKLGR